MAARVRRLRLAGRGARGGSSSSRAARSTGSSTEASSDVDGNLGRFLVGHVVEAGKHPNADRLQLCRVDVGEGEPRQIVCGAWNFGAGATVAVALPGALLPGADQPLGEAKLRGETSRGMILSERELELGDDHSGIMVLDGRARAGDAARGRAAADGDGARDRDWLQPAGPDVDLRHRPGGLGPDRCGAGTAAGAGPGAGGRRAGRHPRRGLRGLPALHRPDLPRRPGRPVAGLAEGAAPRRRHALDLERRRHHELRHARARLAAARVRPLAPRGGPDRRPPRAAGGEDPDARRPRARARADRPRHRRRQAAGRGRRDHGR